MFVLVNIRSDDIRKNTYPLGLAYIAASFERFGIVRVFDFHYEDCENEFIEYIFSNQIRFVGFSVCSHPGCMQEAVRLARQVKVLSPRTLVGIGGAHPTNQGIDIISHHMEYDLAFIGEGEVASSQLGANLLNNVSNWFEGVNNIIYRDSQGKVKVSEPSGHDMTCTLLPARHLLPGIYFYAKKQKQEVPVLSIDTSRGCPGRCSFCAFTLNKNKRWQVRSLEAFYDDIKNSIEFQQIKEMDIFFVDADFLASTKRAKKVLEILNGISQLRFFSISARADSILRAEDMLDELFIAGCNHVEVGIESASESQLQRYEKRTSQEINRKAMDLLVACKSKYVFEYQLDIILFEPFVTMDELKLSNEFIQKYTYGSETNEINIFHKMHLFPGTKYREMSINSQLACGCSEMSIPFWLFQSNEVAVLYSYVSAFERFIYLRKKKIQEKLKESIKNQTYKNLSMMKDLRWLQTASYDYLNLLINTKYQTKYKDIYNNFTEKLIKIEETYAYML